MQAVITKQNADGSFDEDDASENVLVIFNVREKIALLSAEVQFPNSVVRAKLYHGSRYNLPDRTLYLREDGKWYGTLK